MKIVLSCVGCVCALGTSLPEICKNIPNAHLGKRDTGSLQVPFGAVDIPRTNRMRCYDLLDKTLEQIQQDIDEVKNAYPKERLGIVLGSSNTGIHEAQEHINRWLREGQCPSEFSFDEIELGSPAVYLKKKVGFLGPAYVVSTACSSSAKAFISARNLLNADICDVVLVGGVDSCCDFALNGFNALEALSHQQSLPFSKNRQGINLGEGAALFLMKKGDAGIVLAGAGESSDGYHLTHPDPDGAGALLSMQDALNDARIDASQVDYINLHGTGTQANDAMESKAVFKLFGRNVLCASTKPLTGHALGASGALEVALSWLMLKENFIIPHFYDGKFDPELEPITLATGEENTTIHTILSNSFAFGGSNASIILTREDS